MYVFHQNSARTLFDGRNPYEGVIPNIYSDNSLYGDKLVNGENLTIGNPYPPLSIYLSSLGFLLGGDIRYSHLAAIVFAAALMIFLRPNKETLLAASIFLFTPRVFFVLEQSWTEPLIVVSFVIVIWSVLNCPKWTPFALGLLLASKQYMIFMVPFIFLLVPVENGFREWKQILTRMLWTAFVVTAPLAFLGLSGFSA